MKSRPVLFSGAMVRAILAGTKTQTRRLAKWPRAATLHGRTPAPEYSHGDGPDGNEYFHAAYGGGDLGEETVALRVACPYGEPGDRLWVRESWRPVGDAPLSECEGPSDIMFHATCHEDDRLVFKFRPSIHMPRWASRITLEVTGVRVERLCDISEEDAKAEGVTPFEHDPEGDCWTARPRNEMYRSAFEHLWGEINGWDGEPGARAPWTTNPWVWVVGFRRVEQIARTA